MTDGQNPRSITWRDFPDFYTNTAIQALSHESRWTISSTKPIETVNGKTGEKYVLPAKSPLDVRELSRHDNIRGAFSNDETCLMTLDELNSSFMGAAANNAFYLNAQIDEVLVLDIEPSCPPEIRDLLLSLPALYRETSMSGHGYHMIMPMPDNFWDYPVAASKRKLQHDQKWYEIMIEHWITFTRNVDHVPHPAPPGSDPLTWEQVYEDLAQEAVESARAEFVLDEERPELPMAEVIYKVMTDGPKYNKTLADFHDDYSRWEYGHFGFLCNRLEELLSTRMLSRAHPWSESDRAWLLYEAAQRILPPRDKHVEMRTGLPYLLYVANGLVAERLSARRDRNEQ